MDTKEITLKLTITSDGKKNNVRLVVMEETLDLDTTLTLAANDLSAAEVATDCILSEAELCVSSFCKSHLD